MARTNKITIEEGEWMSMGLSNARFFGVCRINGVLYRLERRSQTLVKDDYYRLVKPLGLDTLRKADKRYGSGRKSKYILLRLYHIISTHKRLKNKNYAHR